jgi:DNA-binding PadR family transcriptional regulator
MQGDTLGGWAGTSAERDWVRQATDELRSRAEELRSRAEDFRSRAGDFHRSRGSRRHGWGTKNFGGGPFGWPWMSGAPRPRPRRGDVRLAVLTLLAEQPMHGYQIITELTERSDGVWRPSPGSIYPTLQQLEDEGLVSVVEQEGRRTFTLTEAGREEVDRLSRGRRAPWEELADADGEDTGGLRALALQVLAAAMQVSVVGNQEQVEQAEAMLARTRRRLYRLLAEDDREDEE